MFKKGFIMVSEEGNGDIIYEWEAKVYDTGSTYGIHGGRVSKLSVVKTVDNRKKIVINYDRGWDIRPSNYAEWLLVSYICNVVFPVVKGHSLHKEVIFFIINDFLESENEEYELLQEKVREVGLDSIYEEYMDSDEMFFNFEDTSSIIKNLIERLEAKPPKW